MGGRPPTPVHEAYFPPHYTYISLGIITTVIYFGAHGSNRVAPEKHNA